MGAIAQTQQAISRAVAQFATQGLFPACDMASRLSRRRRLHFAACLDAAGATPWPGLGFLGWRVDIGTCHDASTSARLTREFPARVIPPRDSVSPLERSEGASPHHAANDGALGNLEKSPASAASRNAVATLLMSIRLSPIPPTQSRRSRQRIPAVSADVRRRFRRPGPARGPSCDRTSR